MAFTLMHSPGPQAVKYQKCGAVLDFVNLYHRLCMSQHSGDQVHKVGFSPIAQERGRCVKERLHLDPGEGGGEGEGLGGDGDGLNTVTALQHWTLAWGTV